MKPITRRTKANVSRTTPVTTVTPRPEPATLRQPAQAASEQKPVPAPPLRPATVEVNFRFFEPKAARVSLCSEFNGWSPEATPMSRCADGHWSVTLGLKPGKYQYKFFVDGHWIPDPNAHESLFNQFGTLNSVVEIQA